MQKRRGVPSIRHLIPGAFVFSILLSLVIFLFLTIHIHLFLSYLCIFLVAF